jgi:AraC-like DNA-binding protein
MPRAASGATSASVVLRALAAYVAHRGGDLLAALAAELPEDPDARIPFELLVRAWPAAARLTGDDAFGLHFAEAAAVGSFGVFDYVTRARPTLGEALACGIRYQRLLHDAVEFGLRLDGEVAIFSHRAHGEAGGAPRHAAEAALASWLVRTRVLTGVALQPIAVRFEHAAPSAIAEHRRIFGIAPGFGAGGNELHLARADLARPLATADAGLAAVLERHATTLLAALPAGEAPLARVRRVVAEELRLGTPSAATVAKRLHASVRSLQRLLAEHGTSFRDLVDELRRELAERYLAEPTISVTEAAFLLGFSEPSAFHRAFRRWRGTTPEAFRRAST